MLAPLLVVLWWRVLTGDPLGPPALPHVEPLYLMAGLCFVPVWLGVGGSLVAGPAPVRLPPA